jgi:hypothetical protein
MAAVKAIFWVLIFQAVCTRATICTVEFRWANAVITIVDMSVATLSIHFALVQLLECILAAELTQVRMP